MVRAQGWTESYAYDEAGNQIQASWPATHTAQESTGTRAYSGTRITRAGNIRYEHDEAGRLTLRQKTRLSKKPDTWHYAWDAEDRLTAVTTPDGTVWRYLYDPFGRRTAKHRLEADGETVAEQVDFTWDGPTLIEQTSTAPDLAHPVTLTWDHQGLYPISQTERITEATTQREIDQRFFAIVTDLVGTPTELVDETGDIAWHTRSTLWGTTTWTTDSSTYTPLRFPGQYYDPETGLHYNHHRYYDPTTARYLTPDPLGLAPAPNPLAYVRNPHTGADPLGLAPCPYMELGPESGKGIVAELDDNGIMSLVIERGHDTPRGSEMFDNAMRHFGDATKGVKAYWQNGGTLRDNLDSFNSAVNSGVSFEDAARATFTGKMAARYGFTNVEIVELRGMPGDYTNVSAVFTKPGS